MITLEKTKDKQKTTRQGIRHFSRRLFHRTLPRIGAVVVVLFVFGAIFAPLITPYDPIEPDYSVVRQSPSTSHLMGTDDLGRDIFTRILYGGRISFYAALIPLIISD